MSAAGEFRARARAALLDDGLQQALARARGGFVDKRRAALAALPEYPALRAAARALQDRTLDRLEHHLERFAAALEAAGGRVHHAADAAQACRQVVAICRHAGARLVAKGKTMVGEEIGLNAALAGAGVRVVETDLGEYIIQLAGEPPSHIIAPAVHKRREQIAELFRAHHRRPEPLDSVQAIVDQARQELRPHFLGADVGVTGANLLVADTGSVVLVTNEGNGDLAATLPRTHIVVAGIERLVPALDDASLLLRLLARSATGQACTAYTTLFTGPRRPGDPDGPEALHVVLVDNGRREILAGLYREMLRCVRCGACLNHCPVYASVGGHAYGAVYPGPMGSVLTPLLRGLGEAPDLPHACTLCGRCAEVCPMSIPLPALLRRLRADAHAAGLAPAPARAALKTWGLLARRPSAYAALAALGARGLRALAGSRPPLTDAWTASRELPPAAGETFTGQWRRTRGHTPPGPGPASPEPPPPAQPESSAAAGPHPLPAIGPDPVSRFTQRLEAGAATWTAAADPGEAVSAVLGYLHAAGLPPRLVISAAAAALELPWPPDAEVRVRAARADEPVALLLADAGIAETGSVVLSSGPASPTTLALLPDHLICLLRQQDLLAYPEDLWRRLRGQPLPRALVLLTGPSRTADVEQTLQLGAHGARRLHLVLLG